MDGHIKLKAARSARLAAESNEMDEFFKVTVTKGGSTHVVRERSAMDDTLWKKQQAVQRRARNQGKGILGSKLTHKCLCACGLKYTTKGIAQHQRRCRVQQDRWNDASRPTVV